LPDRTSFAGGDVEEPPPERAAMRFGTKPDSMRISTIDFDAMYENQPA
jgi:hypothetical protein